ncbi:MAG: flavocytochrome c [Clostridia bacterium]|nr:flavocytochrome c [Clostridia bacterium]
MKKSILALAMSAVMLPCTLGMAYTPGTYEATTTGHNAPITLAVTVDENSITAVDVTVENETIGVGKVALETMTKRIIDEQSLAVDVLSGASVTSYAVLRAAGDALQQAGGDMEALKAAPVKEAAQDAVYETDVVVVGGGGAGLAAAISAAQNGAKVIVVEKLDILGGSTNVSEGALNAVDPVRQGAQGIEDSVEKFITQTYEGGHKVGDMELISYMCNNSMAAIEWMESLGVTFKPECGTATGALWQRSHYPTTPSGNSYIRVYENVIANDANIDVLYGTEAKSLITEDGKVTGVNAVGKEGNAVTVKASKGVILATGGFGANKALLKEYNTGVWAHVDVTTLGCTNMAKSATGAGIEMATAIGADVTGMSDIQLHPCGTPGTGLMENIRTSGRNRIFVNIYGDRFVNEGAARDTLAQAIFDQDQQTYYVVVNSVRYPSRDYVDNNGATIANMVAQGSVIEADTLAELAEKTGMDAAKLQASVDNYNAVVRGEVEDALGFQANNKADVEMTEGPWYACKKVPTVHHTMGGLKINVNTEVLGTDGNVIPGLFACGEVTGGIHGSNRLGGNAIADCMTFGRLAGINAAK